MLRLNWTCSSRNFDTRLVVSRLTSLAVIHTQTHEIKEWSDPSVSSLRRTSQYKHTGRADSSLAYRERRECEAADLSILNFI